MPIEYARTVNVTCDNPNCPGHPELVADDLAGWLVISSEVYGEPTNEQTVFGSVDCLNEFTAGLGSGETEFRRSAMAPPMPEPEPEPEAETESSPKPRRSRSR